MFEQDSLKYSLQMVRNEQLALVNLLLNLSNIILPSISITNQIHYCHATIQLILSYFLIWPCPSIQRVSHTNSSKLPFTFQIPGAEKRKIHLIVRLRLSKKKKYEPCLTRTDNLN